jgi:hypothetical protein
MPKKNENISKESNFTLKNKDNSPKNIKITSNQLDYEGVSVSINPDNFSIKPDEEINVTVTLNIASDNNIPRGYNEFSLNISYDDNSKMHIEAMYYYGDFKQMDYVLESFSYPTLAISPNNDDSGDYNYFYFLSPNIVDGYEVDLFDDKGKQQLGVLTYGRERIGSGFFRVKFDGTVNGRLLNDGIYTFRPYLLPIGKDYKQSTNWVTGKEAKVLIDRVPPKIDISMEKNPNEKSIHVSGKITDNNESLGLYLYYEIDDEDFTLANVKSDGTFSFNIDISPDNFWIRFTAQDLAGNTTMIKKSIIK